MPVSSGEGWLAAAGRDREGGSAGDGASAVELKASINAGAEVGAAGAEAGAGPESSAGADADPGADGPSTDAAAEAACEACVRSFPFATESFIGLAVAEAKGAEEAVCVETVGISTAVSTAASTGRFPAVFPDGVGSGAAVSWRFLKPATLEATVSDGDASSTRASSEKSNAGRAARDGVNDPTAKSCEGIRSPISSR